MVVVVERAPCMSRLQLQPNPSARLPAHPHLFPTFRHDPLPHLARQSLPSSLPCVWRAGGQGVLPTARCIHAHMPHPPGHFLPAWGCPLPCHASLAAQQPPLASLSLSPTCSQRASPPLPIPSVPSWGLTPPSHRLHFGPSLDGPGGSWQPPRHVRLFAARCVGAHGHSDSASMERGPRGVGMREAPHPPPSSSLVPDNHNHTHMGAHTHTHT